MATYSVGDLSRREILKMSAALAGSGVVLASGLGAPAAAAPEGTMTWGVHITLASRWLDPAGTEGIITTTDIVEEILSDAAPRGETELYIEPLDRGRFLVSGNARLDDLSEHLGFELEAEGIGTIGGLVFNQLGYLPPSGTRLELPRLDITVRKTGRKRIEEVLLQKTTGGGEADARAFP